MHARLLYLTILVAITALALVACGGDDGTAKAPRQSVSIRSMPTKAPTVPPPTVPPAPTPTASGTVIRVINHDTAGSGKYEFEPSEFNFKLGETVTFEIVGETELHSFTVDDLGIDVDVDATETPNKIETLVHTFDKAGTFKLICIYHEGFGMLGTITVQ